MNNQEYVNKNYNLICYVADKIGSKLSIEDREDLVQDTVIKLLEAEDIKDKDHPSAFINLVMKRVLINKSRDNRVDALGNAESIDQPIYEEDGVYNLHDKIAAAVEGICSCGNPDLHYYMTTLTGVEKQVFKLRYCSGYTNDEISEMLDTPLRTIERRISTAKAKVFTIVEEEEE